MTALNMRRIACAAACLAAAAGAATILTGCATHYETVCVRTSDHVRVQEKDCAGWPTTQWWYIPDSGTVPALGQRLTSGTSTAPDGDGGGSRVVPDDGDGASAGEQGVPDVSVHGGHVDDEVGHPAAVGGK